MNESMDEKTSDASSGKVIHVRFGPGGGRVQVHTTPSTPSTPPAQSASTETRPGAVAEPPTQPVEQPREAPEHIREHAPLALSEPVTDVFAPAEVIRLLGVTSSRLRTLSRAGIVAPSGRKRGRAAYTFQDLIALRATQLLARTVRLKEVARAISVLRQTLPKVTRPLQQLRIVSDGRRLVVRAHEGAFEPITGQLVLDFEIRHLQDDIVRVLRPETKEKRVRTAYELYLRASSLDEDPRTFDEAESLYARAVELDPRLAIAYTNLGNLRYRRGDVEAAETLYKRALATDEHQAEAHYNLGYIALERGEAEVAAKRFTEAVALDPRFADAHFNLAMALEESGNPRRARTHWRKYLDLEPEGAWAEIAREHLKF